MRNVTPCPIQQRRQLVLHARARQHRSALNFPEQILWDAVSGGKLGVYFRRQVVVGRYIVDMFAPSIRLVVEVDGRVHALRRAADARRDRDLGRLGYRVLRIPAVLVLHDRESAVALVRAGVMRVRW
jgi:histidinol dehydrogenase/leucyl-tRNA synthetase/ATP-dependent DNA helicase RecG